MDNNPNDTSFNSSFTNSNNGSYKQHSNGLEIDPFMYNNDPQQIDINNEYNENMKKRKQDEEFMGNINKKTKSEINNENITISENPFNDDMQDDIDLGTKAPENITIIENEEETRKKKEKNEQLKQQKLILLKKKKECLDQEIELLDKILSKYPKVERKVVPPITPTTSIPPIKTVTKPVKKKAAEKKVVKKETKVVKKEPKVKPEAPEKKKPKKEVAVKKETPKKEVKKEAPKKEVKKEAPKKEVKKEVKKEQTAVKKEVKKKEEVAKKEPKKEAPKKTASSKQKSKTKKFERCRNILDALMNDKLAVAFNIPVDYVYFNIPDYPKKIKEPMDFGTIKKTLESDKYSEVSEFVSDIELVFDNCWKYNGVNSEIGGYATHLSESFKTLSAGIEDEDDDDFTPVDKKKKAAPKKKPGAPTTAVKKTPTIKKKEEKVAPTPTPTKSSRRRSLTKSTISEDVTPQTVEMEKTIFSLNEKLSELQNQMEKMKKSQEINQKKEKKEKPTSPKKKPKSTPKTAPKKTPVTIKKEDARPMTFKEKHDLSLQINNLDGDSLGEVVKIISERMPELANNTAPDEIEIDIDALDAITLRCLERFVKSCNTKKKRSTKKPRESPENITIEDKQLLVIEAAHSTSSSIRELERELATMEGRPVPPPIDVPLALPVKKNQKKKNIDPNDIFMNDENSISDSDFMSSEDENDELQIVPTNNPSSVSFDSGFMHNSSQYLSSTLSTPISNNNVSNNNSNNSNNNGKKDGVVIKNIASWNLGDDNTSVNTDSNSNQPFDKSGELWKKLQNRETINKQKEKERELQEVKIRQEKERQEREKREKLELIDKEKREKERMLLEEQEKERLEHESKREQERLRAIQELELSEKTVDLHDNHDMIESFEKSLYN